ncbi:MAG: LptA/OstA family protein [Sporomusaceae bacterium]|nr:LptA/OstA family protein [Sporomusaceae bacterium]
MKRKFAAAALTALIMVLIAATTAVSAPADKPVELIADTIEYDAKSGVMNAQGAVKLTRDKAVLTGANAQYNTKSKEAYVFGNVKVVREDTTLTANEVRSFEDNYLVATGNAVLIKGENTLAGPKIEHWVDRQYSLVPTAARLTMPDGWMTANRVEAFHTEDRAVADGDVHIVSDKRSLDATSDKAVYYGSKTEQGKVVMSGNARAVQEGNILTGKTLTIYLDDKAMDSQGRSKLVVKPQ